MDSHMDYVAGEPLQMIEHALAHLKICDLPCGCLGFTGTLPTDLSQSLERALKTIDAELSELADTEDLSDEEMDSVRELLLRLGRSEATA
jgi:hypothetical protein